MVIFNSYVKLPEGIAKITSILIMFCWISPQFLSMFPMNIGHFHVSKENPHFKPSSLVKVLFLFIRYRLPIITWFPCFSGENPNSIPFFLCISGETYVPMKSHISVEIGEHPYLGMDQYLLIPFLGGWTSIYQLFWCELQGYTVLTHCHLNPTLFVESPWANPVFLHHFPSASPLRIIPQASALLGVWSPTRKIPWARCRGDAGSQEFPTTGCAWC